MGWFFFFFFFNFCYDFYIYIFCGHHHVKHNGLGAYLLCNMDERHINPTLASTLAASEIRVPMVKHLLKFTKNLNS